MTLIKSISGIRGTIGGKPGTSLTPADVFKYAVAFSLWLAETYPEKKLKVVIGRDARVSGEMVSKIVSGVLLGMGVDVIDLGLSTTPTVEIAVPLEHADGGIIITASHNPKQWNALKLLNNKGEFISGADGQRLLTIADRNQETVFPGIEHLGKYCAVEDYIERHIKAILNLELVDVKTIKAANFKVVVDAVNSTGGIAVPMLLEALGVNNIIKLFCEPTGLFPHNPEPLLENLSAISGTVIKEGADLGIVVDPDVDRLAFVCEDGEMFGEEYTLVAVADYILSEKGGNSVSNLSSTRALKDITEKHRGTYFSSAVGEVNVVKKMKEHHAIIGGEGNGGIIFPELHYGRDALVGIALMLTHLAKSKKRISRLKQTYPQYHISKNKIELTPEINIDELLNAIIQKYKNYTINKEDGVKIEFDKEWVHLRKSNTEPIIRIYSESDSLTKAEHLSNKIMSDCRDLITNPVE